MATDLTTIMAARLARRDVPRDVPRVSVLVDSTTDGLCFGGNVLHVGEQTIEIYEDEVPKLEALIETDEEGLALARVDYEAHVEEVAAKQGATTERHYRPALAASFRHLRRRDPLPLRRVEVVGSSGRRRGKRDEQQAA